MTYAILEQRSIFNKEHL